MEQNLVDELTVTLVRPINIGREGAEVEYAELQLTEPTYKQLVQAGKAGSAMEQLGTLIHLNAKVPMAVVDQLRQRDLEACGAFFGRFSEDSPETPETSSLS